MTYTTGTSLSEKATVWNIEVQTPTSTLEKEVTDIKITFDSPQHGEKSVADIFKKDEDYKPPSTWYKLACALIPFVNTFEETRYHIKEGIDFTKINRERKKDNKGPAHIPFKEETRITIGLNLLFDAGRIAGLYAVANYISSLF